MSRPLRMIATYSMIQANITRVEGSETTDRVIVHRSLAAHSRSWDDPKVDRTGNQASARVIESSGLWSDRGYVRTRLRSTLYADDFVREDRRSIVALPDMDADAYLATFDTWFELEDGRPMVVIDRVVAVRGERHVLIEMSIKYATGSSGGSHLIACQYDERVDKVERLVAFDLNEEAAAIAELDRMHADSPG